MKLNKNVIQTKGSRHWNRASEEDIMTMIKIANPMYGKNLLSACRYLLAFHSNAVRFEKINKCFILSYTPFSMTTEYQQVVEEEEEFKQWL